MRSDNFMQVRNVLQQILKLQSCERVGHVLIFVVIGPMEKPYLKIW